jgi:protein-tyrosine phosphatase
MIVCLCLLILQVPVIAIAHDYLLSEDELVVERESRLQEIASIGLGEDFAGCPENWVEEMVSHIDGAYGGISDYLRSIGFQQQDEEVLVRTMSV